MASPDKENPNLPKDPHNLVYIIVYWLGVGTLMPWNFFLAVNGYWMHKFRDTNITIPDETDGAASNETIDTSRLTSLQLIWGPYLSMAAMIPNVSILLINAVYGHRFKMNLVLVASLLSIILIFAFTAAMTQVDTDEWQNEFMKLTLFTVVVFNIMVAFFQGGLIGTLGRFPASYMGALIQGQAVGGIIPVAINIAMLAIGLDPVNAAFCDFLFAVFYLGTALVAFYFVTKTEFYKFYSEGGESESVSKDLKPDESNQLLEGGDGPPVVQMAGEKPATSIVAVAYRIWIWILAVFICFFCTLAVFPSITGLAFSTQHPEGTAWGTTYFIPVACFLLYNIGDFIGRLLASWIKWPGPNVRGSIITLVMSISRLVFIPLFMICNVSPQNRNLTPVLIRSDTVYIILMTLFSMSSGYIGNICLSFAPKTLADPVEQGQAASLTVFFLVFGLAIGSAFSSLSVSLL